MGTPRLAALVAIGLVAAIAAAPASAEVPDAKCEGTPSGIMGDNRVAQPFTALNTGQLVRFEAFFNDPSSAVSSTWTVQINTVDVSTDKPTNTALASTSVPVAGSGSNSGLPIGGTFPNPAQVTAGERYALVIDNDAAGNAPMAVGGNPCSGRVYGDSSPTGTWPFEYPSVDLAFATFVEPPAPQSEPVDSQSPTATITKGPKDKTKKKTATFEFTGTDTRAIASFQCRLDNGAFAACTSPYTVKVKKGRHNFQVRAVDEAGNVGSAAKDDWKVKKKKRR